MRFCCACAKEAYKTACENLCDSCMNLLYTKSQEITRTYVELNALKIFTNCTFLRHTIYFSWQIHRPHLSVSEAPLTVNGQKTAMIESVAQDRSHTACGIEWNHGRISMVYPWNQIPDSRCPHRQTRRARRDSTLAS